MSECPSAGEGAWRGLPNGLREERSSRDLSDLSTVATWIVELGGVGRGPGLPGPRPLRARPEEFPSGAPPLSLPPPRSPAFSGARPEAPPSGGFQAHR